MVPKFARIVRKEDVQEATASTTGRKGGWGLTEQRVQEQRKEVAVKMAMKHLHKLHNLQHTSELGLQAPHGGRATQHA